MSLNWIDAVSMWLWLATALRIVLGLAGLGLLGLAFQERRKKAVRIAAGVGAAVIFAALAANLIWYVVVTAAA